MIDQDQAMADGRRAAGAMPPDRLIERLAELIGARAGIQAVFGEPVRQGAVTVIPVARVRWGFGGGGGRSDAAPDGPASGSGGGGGSPRTRSGMSRWDLMGPRSARSASPIRARYSSSRRG
jgi:hypothetical protein